MNKSQILDFLNTNPVCHLATVEGDQPRVRGMMMYKADQDGIVFRVTHCKAAIWSMATNFEPTSYVEI